MQLPFTADQFFDLFASYYTFIPYAMLHPVINWADGPEAGLSDDAHDHDRCAA